MSNFIKRVALGLTLALMATAAQAQSSINDCEKIQAADAYNQCLAKFGPPSKAQNLEPEKPADIKGSSEEAAATSGKAKLSHAGAGRRGRGRHVGHRHSGGRKRMTIIVGHRRR